MADGLGGNTKTSCCCWLLDKVCVCSKFQDVWWWLKEPLFFFKKKESYQGFFFEYIIIVEGGKKEIEWFPLFCVCMCFFLLQLAPSQPKTKQSRSLTSKKKKHRRTSTQQTTVIQVTTILSSLLFFPQKKLSKTRILHLFFSIPNDNVVKEFSRGMDGLRNDRDLHKSRRAPALVTRNDNM